MLEVLESAMTLVLSWGTQAEHEDVREWSDNQYT